MSTPQISNFLTSFDAYKGELARPCNFKVSLYPTGLNLFGIFAAAFGTCKMDPITGLRNLELRCDTAELPSRSFSAVDQKTYGPISLYPIQTVYDKINLTFLCSDNMVERWLFDYWMNGISNALAIPLPTTATDIIDMIGSGGRPRVNYDFEFKVNYECFITITQYDLSGSPSYGVGLFHAFPISMNQLPLAWNSTDNFHRLTVTFAYRYFNALTL